MTKQIPERPQLHKTKNRGYVRTRCEQTGKRKTKYFKGEFGSVQMWDDFNAWRRREMGQRVPERPTLDQAARRPAVAAASTIYELCSMFMAEVLQDRRHGREDQTLADRSEITHTKLALRLLTPYADMAVDDFKTAHLAMARETEIAMGNSCKTINGKIQKIVRMFRHAAAEEICTGETWKRLEAWYKDKKLTPKKNKSIPGPRKVHAAPLSDVLAVAAAAPPTISCMITVQSTTGMRSANVCSMSWDRIDQSLYKKQGVWKYTPERHKTSDAGHTLSVFLGPQAIQAILDYEKIRPDKHHPFLFNPRASRAWRYFKEQPTSHDPASTPAARAILKRLRQGPATSAELRAVRVGYSSTLQALRRAGYRIERSEVNNVRCFALYSLRGNYAAALDRLERGQFPGQKPNAVALKILAALMSGPQTSNDLTAFKSRIGVEIQHLRRLGFDIRRKVTDTERTTATFTFTGSEPARQARPKTWRQYYQQQSGAGANMVFSTKSYCDAVQRVQRKIGSSHWTPHQLRHLHNERLVESKYGDSGAAAVLGHNTLEMTRNYSKSQDESLAAEAQRMLG